MANWIEKNTQIVLRGPIPSVGKAGNDVWKKKIKGKWTICELTQEEKKYLLAI